MLKTFCGRTPIKPCFARAIHASRNQPHIIHVGFGFQKTLRRHGYVAYGFAAFLASQRFILTHACILAVV
jgi:hypothetical protein